LHKRIASRGILKFALQQIQNVSVSSPSSGSALFELAKVTVDKNIQLKYIGVVNVVLWLLMFLSNVT
jgi:hypothetical protein